MGTTVYPDARPLICSETGPIAYHLGKITATGQPDLTEADIRKALVERSDPVPYIRRLTGDTDDTIKAIKIHNAAWDALCVKPKGESK